MQVNAYAIFTLKSGADSNAVKDKLHMGLGMCKQVFVGAFGQDLVYHLESTEESGRTNLDAALARLSAVDGIASTTVAPLKS